jgi:hypothetical protein
MKVININGYMGSGRSAVTDIFREFQNYSVPSSDHEFELLNHSDGLNSLYSTMESRSHASFSNAIIRFIKLTEYLGRDPRGINKYYKWGGCYEKRYNDFSLNTHKFINAICLSHWKENHPHGNIYKGGFKSFVSKVKSRIIKEAPWPECDFYLMNFNDFNCKFIEYLELILKPSGLENVVINNGFEVSCSDQYFKFFRNPYCINVNRDIRDIYLTMKLAKRNYYSSHYMKISGAFDVKVFGQYQDILHKNIISYEEGRVLDLRFEDLILDYDDSFKTIFQFINEDPSIHINKKKYFSPDSSFKNIRLWNNRKLSKKILSDVKYLEKHFAHLCYL